MQNKMQGLKRRLEALLQIMQNASVLKAQEMNLKCV